MKLPGADKAIVDMNKLVGYCLNPHHTRGRHKARRFEEVLGINVTNAGLLRAALLVAAHESEAVIANNEDRFGKRFVIEFTMEGPKASGRIRSGWIVLTGEDFPRLATCYVL